MAAVVVAALPRYRSHHPEFSLRSPKPRRSTKACHSKGRTLPLRIAITTTPVYKHPSPRPKSSLIDPSAFIKFSPRRRRNKEIELRLRRPEEWIVATDWEASGEAPAKASEGACEEAFDGRFRRGGLLPPTSSVDPVEKKTMRRR